MDVNIVVATANAGKLREIREICAGLPVSLCGLRERFPDAPEIEETGTTFHENALIKARWVSGRCREWALADDSGLEVDALDGRPGVYSARYGGENGNHAKNIALLLQELRDVRDVNRTARFRCVMVLVAPDGRQYTAEGVCEGMISRVASGTGGFGYDPVFVPCGYEQTFAQLDSGIKNGISHRGRALHELRCRLDTIAR